MSVTFEGVQVGRKKKGEPKGEGGRGSGRPVRLDPDVVRKAQIVVAKDGVELGQYLSALLRAAVNKDYLRVAREINEETEGGSK